MNKAIEALATERPETDTDDCSHDYAEIVYATGQRPYNTQVWECPDCGMRKTEEWEP